MGMLDWIRNRSAPKDQVMTSSRSGGVLRVTLDLDRADVLLADGDSMAGIGVRISGIRSAYLKGALPWDGYEKVSDWYRKELLGAHGQLVAVQESFLEGRLANAPKGALEYLLIDGEDRKRAGYHTANDAVRVAGWVFPAHAIDGAAVSLRNTDAVSIEARRAGQLARELRYDIRNGRISYRPS